MSEAGEFGGVQREHAPEPRVKSQVTKMIESYREGLLGEGQPRPWGGGLWELAGAYHML